MRSLSLLALLALPLAGCEEIEPYLPSVSFDRLDVLSVDWDAIDANFVFQVENPNPVDIQLASFDYTLAFEGVEWLSGGEPDGWQLGAGTSELPLEVSCTFQDLYDVVQAVRGEDDIAFSLSGRFAFDTPIGLVELPYDADGGFPALRTPAVDLGKLRVDSLDLSGASLELDITLDNDHGSNIWFEDFDYSISLLGQQVASGLIPDFAEVDGATTTTVTLPFEVDFLSAGTSIYEALTGSAVDVELQADTEVDTPFGLIPLSIDQSARLTPSR